MWNYVSNDFYYEDNGRLLLENRGKNLSMGVSVKNKVAIGAWIYFWAFYLVPLVYISVFVPGPYCLDDCSFVVYNLKSGRLIPPAPFFFHKIALASKFFCISIHIVILFVLVL